MPKGDEKRIAVLFQKAYKNRKLTSKEAAEAKAIADRNTASINIWLMGYGARHHDRNTKETLDPYTAGGKQIFDPHKQSDQEIFGWFYPWWTYAVVCTIKGWSPYCAAVAAFHSLHLGKVTTIAYHNPNNTASKPLTRRREAEFAGNKWRGPLSQPPASRCLWGLDKVPRIERGVGARILAGAAALKNHHEELDWAGEILSENLDAFDFDDPVEAMNELQLRRGQWYRVWRYPNGNWLSIAGISTHNTRGHVGVCEYDSKTKTLTMRSPARPTTKGNWSRVVGSVSDDSWELESGGRTMRGKIPKGASEVIIWDRKGARREGEEPKRPGPKQPPKQPSTGSTGSDKQKAPSAKGAVARAITHAQSIPDLADVPKPSATAAKTALQRIKNRAAQIVKLLEKGTAGGRTTAIRHAKSLPDLADIPKPAGAAAKTALQKIKNRARQIVRLLANGGKDASHPKDRFHFSAFHPERVGPRDVGRLIAFAHVHSVSSQVAREAARRLDLSYGSRIVAKTDEPDVDVPRESVIRVTAEVPGLEFEMRQATLSLWEDSQSVEFRFRPAPTAIGHACRGWVGFWLEGMVLALLRVTVFVAEDEVPEVFRQELAEANARPYRRVFPSYSHSDCKVVNRLEIHAASFGDEYLRDVHRLRSGQRWRRELAAFIRRADVFQLFWSENASKSKYVEEEWRFALQQRESRPDPFFLRPVYWAVQPTPRPPRELRDTHFYRLPL